MKRVITHSSEFSNNDLILCMSNVRGDKVRVPHSLPFSFYFSGKNTSHGIRVKPIFNPSKMMISQAGNLKLCDDWDYNPGENDRHISGKSVQDMKEFFRKYLVLFLLVWDAHLYDTSVQDYFEGDMTLHELVKDLDFYDAHSEVLDQVDSIEDLTDVCRKHNLTNFYGN